MNHRARSLCSAALGLALACASARPDPGQMLGALNRAAGVCRAIIDATPFAGGVPRSVDPSPTENACAEVWTVRPELAAGFVPPLEYGLLLPSYLKLSLIYENAANPDRELIERTRLRGIRIAEDIQSDPALLSYLYGNLARFYLEDRPDEHERVFLKAFLLAEQSGDLSALAQRHRELATVRKDQGRLAEADELSRKDIALVEELLLRIEQAENIDDSRVIGDTREAVETRRSIARRKTEGELKSANALRDDIQLCRRYHTAFEPERAARCCKDDDSLRYFKQCKLPGEPGR